MLKLDVTPHITADGSIIMKIKVSRNAPDSSVATLDGTPGIAKNQVQTETLVKDGQTLVLGGIYVVDRSETGTAVPYLSRLPFLGALFRSNEVRRRPQGAAGVREPARGRDAGHARELIGSLRRFERGGGRPPPRRSVLPAGRL